MTKALLPLLFGAALFISGSAAARDTFSFAGTVSAVDPEKKMLEVTDVRQKPLSFYVKPSTEIEIKRKSKFLPDTNGDFSDIQKGDWLKIEYFRAPSSPFLADEIDIYRD